MKTYIFQFTIFVIELLEDSKALYKPCSRCEFNHKYYNDDNEDNDVDDDNDGDDGDDGVDDNYGDGGDE